MTKRPPPIARQLRDQRAAQLARVRRQQRYTRRINERLNDAKEKTGSDRKTAQAIHLTPQNVSDIRHGRRKLPAHAAMRLARLLNQHVFTALAHSLSDSAKSHKLRDFWLRVGYGLWPLIPDSYANWANEDRRKKYSNGGWFR